MKRKLFLKKVSERVVVCFLESEHGGSQTEQAKSIGGSKHGLRVALAKEGCKGQYAREELELDGCSLEHAETRQDLLPELSGGPTGRVKQGRHVGRAAEPVPRASRMVVF